MSVLRVHTAEPFRLYSKTSFDSAMGSYGDADHMLFSQFNFPDTFNPDEGDVIASGYSDRIVGWYGTRHWGECLEKHAESQAGMSWAAWMQSGKPEGLLALCVDLLKAKDPAIVNRDGKPVEEWTGYRICGGVNVSTQYPYWTFEVFSKGEASTTKVYSGSNAPNVRREKSRRHDDFFWENGRIYFQG